jgi:hypothetical protein
VSDERPVTILMPLVNSTESAWKPVQAIRQREDIYCVVGPMAEGEQWKFPPGSMVRRKPKIMPNGKQEMVASPV